MSYPVYYPIKDDTLPILFDTFDGGTGASITMSGLAVTDIEIYKDGVATTRSSESGYTLLDTDGIDFDSKTGIHGFSIDLSDNTDAGFFTVGPWYTVVVSTITIDGQTVSFIAAAFRILDATRGMTGTALPDAAADAAGGVPISDAGELDLDTKLANTNEVTAARMGALTDWINGGRLDLLLDAIPTTAMRGTDGANTTVPDAAGVAPTATENRQEMDGNSTKLSSIETDTQDIQSRVPAALATGGQIKAHTEVLTTDSVDAAALNTDAVAEIVAAILAMVIEGTTTFQQSQTLQNASAAGKLSGAATATNKLRDLADSIDRITATVDEDGNRSAVTRSYSDL